MNLRSEKLYAYTSAAVSSIDGIAYKTTKLELSAYLGTMAEMLMKMNNRVLTPSNNLHLSNTPGISVILSVMASANAGQFGASMGSLVLFHGVPYFIVQSAAISGALTMSLVSTGASQIRKVLVCLAMPSSVASNTGAVLSYASGTNASNVYLNFVYGSAFGVSGANSVSVGTDSAFDAVPLPKASANQIPIGWLNIVTGQTSAAGVLSAASVRMDMRETQGINFNLFMSAIAQP
jgi:hypothetical protein